jgi:hypothetical protein
LEHPAASGPSPPISITVNDNATLFQHHSSAIAASDWAWVLASGLENVTDVRISMKLDDEFDLRAGVPVIHADDDAEEDEEGNVNLSSSDLELTEDDGTQLVGLRFNGIQLPRGSAIRNAYIQFTCDEPSITSTSLIIAAEDSPSAERFSSDSHDLSSRNRTQTEVGWNPPPWLLVGGSGKAHQTPNLAPLIEAVTSLEDWKAGNSIAFLVSGSGKRIASAYRSGNDRAARLIVEADPPDPQASGQPKTTPYRVRMLFGLPKFGDRIPPVFDVYAQNQRVLTDVSLSGKSEGGSHVIEVIDRVSIAKELHLRLVPKQGKPVLSGLELVRQDDPENQ